MSALSLGSLERMRLPMAGNAFTFLQSFKFSFNYIDLWLCVGLKCINGKSTSYQVWAGLETLVAFAAVHSKLRTNTAVINIPYVGYIHKYLLIREFVRGFAIAG